MSVKRRNPLLIFHIICPLVAGALIYYFLSPDVFFVQKLDAFFGRAFHLPVHLETNSFLLPVRNYLPDFLWGYALVFSLAFIFDNNAVRIEKLFFIAFSFSTVMELLQIMPSVHGTFDVLDIVVEFLAEGIAAIIINNFFSRGYFHDEKKNEAVACDTVSCCICGNVVGKRRNGFR